MSLDPSQFKTKHRPKVWYTEVKRKTLTGLEKEPLTYDYEGIINWLVDSHWVENFIRQKKGCNFKYLDDFIQSVWVQILQIPHEKIVEAFNVGKPRLIAYIKAVIIHNIISVGSRVYKENQIWDTFNQSLTDVQWDLIDTSMIDDDLNYEIPIKKNTVQVENPYDEYADPTDIPEPKIKGRTKSKVQ